MEGGSEGPRLLRTRLDPYETMQPGRLVSLSVSIEDERKRDVGFLMALNQPQSQVLTDL